MQINNVIALDRELMWHDSKWVHLLVIYTDLEIDPYADGYNSEKINAMVAKVAQAHSQEQQGFTSITIRSVNGYAMRLVKSAIAAD